MCNTLFNKGNKYKIGDRVTAYVFRSDERVEGTWSGYIKEEKLDWWKQQTGLKPIEIEADAFVAGKEEFGVPNSRIIAYQLAKDVKFQGKVIGKRGEIKLLTRATVNRFESTIHERWPVVKVGPSRRMFPFQPWDMKGVPHASDQMSLGLQSQ